MTKENNFRDIKNTDVISIARQGNKSCIQVFIYRSGQNWGNRSYFPKHSDEDQTSEILERFIVDFYTKYSPPREVLINHALNDESLIVSSLCSIYDFKTKFNVPIKGKKLDIVKYADRNSQISLKNYIAQKLSDSKNLESLRDTLGIKKKIDRIEAYDNSHLFGKNAVGAMIVYTSEGFDKKSYRKFNIDSNKVKLSDDYGMMRHVLSRRFSNEAIKNSKKYNTLPDIIVIDGGKGHYDIARKILDENGLESISVLSIFKGEGRRETLDQIIYNNKKGFIEKDTPSFFFIQRLRDESHRFALGAHKAKRKRDMKSSELEAIDGLGRIKRKLLLNHFGSVPHIKNASPQDLSLIHISEPTRPY